MPVVDVSDLISFVWKAKLQLRCSEKSENNTKLSPIKQRTIGKKVHEIRINKPENESLLSLHNASGLSYSIRRRRHLDNQTNKDIISLDWPPQLVVSVLSFNLYYSIFILSLESTNIFLAFIERSLIPLLKRWNRITLFKFWQDQLAETP